MNLYSTKTIVFVASPDAVMINLAGPLDVFAIANVVMKEKGYTTLPYHTVVLSSVEDVVVPTLSGLKIVADNQLLNFKESIDTILFCGVGKRFKKDNSEEEIVNPGVVDWIQEHWKEIRRVCSVCGGAFYLAAAGLLDNRKATTHWGSCQKLQKQYPKIEVDPLPIFVKSDSIYTSAGISAGMDLALALVEEDLGNEVALEIARRMVMYLKRPGNQAQFSAAISHQEFDYQPIKELHDWLLENLDKPISVELLADKVSMSKRNFTRIFNKEIGETPAKYIEKLRLEMARRRLVESSLSMQEIAAQCGLGTPDTMRRTFLRHFKTTPSGYRQTFATAYNAVFELKKTGPIE